MPTISGVDISTVKMSAAALLTTTGSLIMLTMPTVALTAVVSAMTST
jgi:hypothetical protein